MTFFLVVAYQIKMRQLRKKKKKKKKKIMSRNCAREFQVESNATGKAELASIIFRAKR